jgi:hypothetical protein
MKSYAQKVLEGTANPSRDRPAGNNPVIGQKMAETLEVLAGLEIKSEPDRAYKYAALYKKLQDIQRQEPGEEEAGNSVLGALLGKAGKEGKG